MNKNRKRCLLIVPASKPEGRCLCHHERSERYRQYHLQRIVIPNITVGPKQFWYRKHKRFRFSRDRGVTMHCRRDRLYSAGFNSNSNSNCNSPLKPWLLAKQQWTHELTFCDLLVGHPSLAFIDTYRNENFKVLQSQTKISKLKNDYEFRQSPGNYYMHYKIIIYIIIIFLNQLSIIFNIKMGRNPSDLPSFFVHAVLSIFLSSSYLFFPLILAVPMGNSLGKHSCRSFTFPMTINILIAFFRVDASTWRTTVLKVV